VVASWASGGAVAVAIIVVAGSLVPCGVEVVSSILYSCKLGGRGCVVVFASIDYDCRCVGVGLWLQRAHMHQDKTQKSNAVIVAPSQSKVEANGCSHPRKNGNLDRASHQAIEPLFTLSQSFRQSLAWESVCCYAGECSF